MSESVWFEEVDTALKELVESVYKGEVPVYIRKPEEDFKVESYPSVTIYNLYSLLDKERLGLPSVSSRNSDRRSLVVEESAIPYNLFYQIDFWSQYQRDMNDLTLKWIASTGRDFNLSVVDKSGKKRSSFVLMVDDLKKSDFLLASDRIYHSMLTYRIYVEIDENISRVEPMMVEPYVSTKRRN